MAGGSMVVLISCLTKRTGMKMRVKSDLLRRARTATLLILRSIEIGIAVIWGVLLAGAAVMLQLLFWIDDRVSGERTDRLW